MRMLKTGDPCPCCGRPIRLKDPDALQLLALAADLMGLPAPEDVPGNVSKLDTFPQQGTETRMEEQCEAERLHQR